MIERLVAWKFELEALVGKPRKISSNLHILTVAGQLWQRPKSPGQAVASAACKGKSRLLLETPGQAGRVIASARGQHEQICRASRSVAAIGMITLTCPQADNYVAGGALWWMWARMRWQLSGTPFGAGIASC